MKNLGRLSGMKLEQGSLLKCVGEVRGSLRPDEIVVNKNCEMVQRVFKMDHDRFEHGERSVFPGRSLERPDTLRISLAKHFWQLAEHGVIVVRLVIADDFPVERFGGRFGWTITLEHRRITAFRVSEVFAHESNTREAEFQLRAKLLVRKVAVDTVPFLAVWIEYQHGRRPHYIEAVKVSRMFFDVRFERDEVFLNE